MQASRPTLGFVLHDVARLLRKRFEQRARHHGLTRSHWQVLALTSANEGIRQGSLADMLEIEPITLVRIVDKLEGRLLIERRQHATDRRVWQLYLTEAARPLLEAMWEIGDETRAEALHGLDAETRARLMSSLSTMKDNLIAACARGAEERDTRHG